VADLVYRQNRPQLFPSAVGSPERIQKTTTHMDRGGTQAAMKAVVEECGIKKKSPSTPFAMPLQPIYWKRD